MFKKYFYTKSLLGLIIGFYQILNSFINVGLDSLSSFFWRYNVKRMGGSSVIQKGVLIRYPGNIELGDRVNIGRRVLIDTEFTQSYLVIGDDSQLNIGTHIDYTGGITMGSNVVISADTRIYTHSHGYNPKAKAIRKPLVIEDDVWIGANCLILENVEYIGKGAMIGAGSVVTKSVKANSIIGGNPARLIKMKDL